MTDTAAPFQGHDPTVFASAAEAAIVLGEQREKFRVAMIDITNEAMGHGLADSTLGRISRLALDALGARDIAQAEAMMKHPTELEQVKQQRDDLLEACASVEFVATRGDMLAPECLECGRTPAVGHSGECGLGQAIAAATPSPQTEDKQ